MTTAGDADGAAEALANVKDLMSRGDLFGAYDAASRALAAGHTTEELYHRKALALARMGDAQRALDIFKSAGLEGSQNPHVRALGARLLKDAGLEGSRKALLGGYLAYLKIWRESDDAYPGINAATLALLLGKKAKARRLAARILRRPEIADASTYYCAATKAEAMLIMGDAKAARAAAEHAMTLPECTVGARAITMRQLAVVTERIGIPARERSALIEGLRAPASFHYTGHIFRPDPVQEARIVREIEAILDARKAQYAFGSIAAGADVLVAETVLRRGGELRLVLPCALPDFFAQSVRPAGEEWVARAEACLERAKVTYASQLDYVSDPALFSYGSAVAMGMARLRAQHLAAESFQLAIWDGSPGGDVGTGADVRLWQQRGGETVVVDAGSVDRDYPRPGGSGENPLPRRTAAILFTDYSGFSRLTESAYPVFDQEIMGRIASVLDANQQRVLARNTWGDALYMVMDGAIAGAEIALQLQQALNEFDPACLGLPPDLGGMRIALHYGSVYQSRDRVTGLPNFLGNEVARAARIEPVTPPGDVYVTQPFAAMVALHAPERFHCRYVGQIDLAKKYGAFPMYRLTAAT